MEKRWDNAAADRLSGDPFKLCVYMTKKKLTQSCFAPARGRRYELLVMLSGQLFWGLKRRWLLVIGAGGCRLQKGLDRGNALHHPRPTVDDSWFSWRPARRITARKCSTRSFEQRVLTQKGSNSGFFGATGAPVQGTGNN